ncbi:MAG: uracil phosphoribosyltransferase [Candidatus Aquicultorales bacterium]
MAVTIVDHPLVGHKLTLLREKTTSSKDFRELLKEISVILTVEATKGLRTNPRAIETPLARAEGVALAVRPVAVPVLRAGLAMIDAFLSLVVDADIGHVGVYRDPHTHEPVEYYFKMPPGVEVRPIFVLDPMLATGGSAASTIDLIKRSGAKDITLVCIIAAPEGVRRLEEAHPDVRVITAAVDERLNDKAYIVPGLGDAGDRLYGTE